MGLDMYLYKKTYVGVYEEDENNRHNVEIKLRGNNYNFQNVKYIVEEAGYWRKANAIHHWFIQHVGGGREESREMYVTTDDLENLYDLCVHAHLSKDPTGLEPIGGFFFGSTDVDEWYWRYILNTIRILKPIVDNKKAIEKLREEYPEDWYDYLTAELHQELDSEYSYEASW